MESKMFHQIMQPVRVQGRLFLVSSCSEDMRRKFCFLHCRGADGKQDVPPDPAASASEGARPSVSSFKLLSGHVPKVLFFCTAGVRMERTMFHQIMQPVRVQGRLFLVSSCSEDMCRKFCFLHCRGADGKQDVPPDPAASASEGARPSVSSFKLLSGHVRLESPKVQKI